MTKIFKRIVDIIFVLFIILLTLYFVLRFMGIIEICEVETGSMEDGIHVGDYILIYRKDNYKIGDIVTFTRDGYYVTHRIIKKNNNKFVTKGDANNTEDDAISSKDIVGKVFCNGGLLNIVIRFKYAIASLFLAIYLLNYYYAKENDSKQKAVSNKVADKKMFIMKEK